MRQNTTSGGILMIWHNPYIQTWENTQAYKLGLRKISDIAEDFWLKLRGFCYFLLNSRLNMTDWWIMLSNHLRFHSDVLKSKVFSTHIDYLLSKTEGFIWAVLICRSLLILWSRKIFSLPLLDNHLSSGMLTMTITG